MVSTEESEGEGELGATLIGVVVYEVGKECRTSGCGE